MTSSVQPDKKLLEEMLASACHFGHKVSKWNPKMKQYIFTRRDGIHIFDLTKTSECLLKALNFLTEAAAAGKTILLVSTKLQATKIVTEAAKQTGCPYVTRKWMPGLLTNFETLKKRIKYFKDLKAGRDSGDWEKYTKKERLEMSRTLQKLEEAFSGVEGLSGFPDVVVVFDCIRDKLALREAKRLKITTVGVCDTNADPDLLTIPIPGNDDAVKSLKFFIGKITQAISDGKRLFEGRTPAKLKENGPNPDVKERASQPETPVV